MILGILVVVVTFGAVVALTRPWWAQALATGRMSRRQANIAAYQSRLTEIARENASGGLDQASADALKLELQQRLLQDAAEVDQAVAVAMPQPRVAIAVAVVLPLFAGIWYYEGGSWRAQQQLERAALAPQEDAQAAQIRGMVDRLAQRLKAQPDDAQGWAMLGRSYFVLKRYPEAAEAYDHANALTQPPDPELLVAEGGALGLATEGDLTGRPRELFKIALRQSPDHMRALWFAGQAALQAQDYGEAQSDWERLLKQELPPELRADVEAGVLELSQRTGRKALIASATPAAEGAEARPAGPPVDAQGPSLRVKVQLAPALASKQKPGQVLYVFAKAATGPPMPLAVQKVHPATWPVELTLDDSMAMAPALRLSQFDRWIVTARLGAEGSPMAQSGDLQGQVTVARAQAPQTVDVLISEQVP